MRTGAALERVSIGSRCTTSGREARRARSLTRVSGRVHDQGCASERARNRLLPAAGNHVAARRRHKAQQTAFVERWRSAGTQSRGLRSPIRGEPGGAAGVYDLRGAQDSSDKTRRWRPHRADLEIALHNMAPLILEGIKRDVQWGRTHHQCTLTSALGTELKKSSL